MINTAESEKMVDQHIGNDDTNAAVKLLFKLIVQSAREKTSPKQNS